MEEKLVDVAALGFQALQAGRRLLAIAAEARLCVSSMSHKLICVTWNGFCGTQIGYTGVTTSGKADVRAAVAALPEVEPEVDEDKSLDDVGDDQHDDGVDDGDEEDVP